MGRIWGFVFLAFGAVWCWDGWRLETSQRADSMFDELGPDRYLVVLGVIMLAVGVSLAFKPVASPMDGTFSLGRIAWWPPRPPVTFTLALIAYTLAIPPLGYTVATFLFFIVIYHLAGKRTLARTLGFSLVSAAVFYVLFEKFADMPLPVGPLGF